MHLTQVVGSEVKKVNLCEACAAKSGLDIKGTISITDLLMGLSGGGAAPAGGGDRARVSALPYAARGFPQDRPARLRGLL